MKDKIVRLNYTSKKARQLALAEKIKLIDEELNKIGVLNSKYLINIAISNPETHQNTVNIATITDVSFAIRLLAYFKNIKYTAEEILTSNFYPKEFDLKNINGVSIEDIIHDLDLRISLLLNDNKIRILQTSKEKLIPFLDEESRFVNALKEIDFLLKKNI